MTRADSRAALTAGSLYGVGFTLFLMTLAINVLAQWVMQRFREVYE